MKLGGQDLAKVTKMLIDEGEVAKVHHGSTLVWEKPTSVQTAKGTSIFDNALNISVDKIRGTTEQVNSASHNIFYFGDNNGALKNGVAVKTDENGYIVANDKMTAAWCVISSAAPSIYAVTLAPGDYTLSFSEPVNYYINLDSDLVNGGYYRCCQIPPRATKASFTLTKPVFHVRLSVIGAQGDNINLRVRPMLEKGKVKHNYEPYTSGIRLGKLSTTRNFNVVINNGAKSLPVSTFLGNVGNARDTIYFEDGKWKVVKRTRTVTLNGSENWLKDNEGDAFGYIIKGSEATFAEHDLSSSTGYCSHYIFDNTTKGWTGVGKCGWWGGNCTFWIQTANNMSPETFKSKIASAKPTVMFVAKKPSVIEITDQALLRQLRALRDIYCDTTRYEVKVETTEAKPILVISYLKKGEF